jgi:hypothetical protein
MAGSRGARQTGWVAGACRRPPERPARPCRSQQPAQACNGGARQPAAPLRRATPYRRGPAGRARRSGSPCCGCRDRPWLGSARRGRSRYDRSWILRHGTERLDPSRSCAKSVDLGVRHHAPHRSLLATVQMAGPWYPPLIGTPCMRTVSAGRLGDGGGWDRAAGCRGARKWLAPWRPAAAAGWRGSASATLCCGCCAWRTWRRSRARSGSRRCQRSGCRWGAAGHGGGWGGLASHVLLRAADEACRCSSRPSGPSRDDRASRPAGRAPSFTATATALRPALRPPRYGARLTAMPVRKLRSPLSRHLPGGPRGHTGRRGGSGGRHRPCLDKGGVPARPPRRRIWRRRGSGRCLALGHSLRSVQRLAPPDRPREERGAPRWTARCPWGATRHEDRDSQGAPAA